MATKRDNFQRDSHNSVKLCVSVSRQEKANPRIIDQIKQQWVTRELIYCLYFSQVGRAIDRQP